MENGVYVRQGLGMSCDKSVDSFPVIVGADNLGCVLCGTKQAEPF